MREEKKKKILTPRAALITVSRGEKWWIMVMSGHTFRARVEMERRG